MIWDLWIIFTLECTAFSFWGKLIFYKVEYLDFLVKINAFQVL